MEVAEVAGAPEIVGIAQVVEITGTAEIAEVQTVTGSAEVMDVAQVADAPVSQAPPGSQRGRRNRKARGRRTPAARRERSVGRGRRTYQTRSLPGVGSRVGTGIAESLDQSVDRRSAGLAGFPTLADRSWFHVVFVVPGRGMPYFSANAPVQSLCLPSRPEPVTTA